MIATPPSMYTIIIIIMAVMTTIQPPIAMAADGPYEDPDNCASQQYSGECCQPGALPLNLGITKCDPGFYCPWLNATDTTIVACPPTPYCTLWRLARDFCDVPQGKHEPLLCKAGYLCSTPATMVKCPAGYYW
jgi:hypothetical protein